MAQRWEYRRVEGQADLVPLGADGWELVALRGGEWIFKRPEPDPAERFTLDQREVALGEVTGPVTVTRRLLNPEVAALIRQVNHTQMLLIADRGFPVPSLPTVVDLSLVSDVPTIIQVLDAILPDLPLDRLILAEEAREASPARCTEYEARAPRVEQVSHLELKRLARHAVGCIRTGDSAAYSNVLLVGG